MNAWSWYWLWWAVLSLLGGFLVPECWALFAKHPENTLSAQIWKLQGVQPGEPFDITKWSAGHFLIGGLLILLFLWLIFHFVFGMFH